MSLSWTMSDTPTSATVDSSATITRTKTSVVLSLTESSYTVPLRGLFVDASTATKGSRHFARVTHSDDSFLRCVRRRQSRHRGECPCCRVHGRKKLASRPHVARDTRSRGTIHGHMTHACVERARHIHSWRSSGRHARRDIVVFAPWASDDPRSIHDSSRWHGDS